MCDSTKNLVRSFPCFFTMMTQKVLSQSLSINSLIPERLQFETQGFEREDLRPLSTHRHRVV